jgi:hypothetical protein
MSLLNLFRRIRGRGDMSQPMKRVNEALNEALEDAPVLPEPKPELPPITHPGPVVLPASFNKAAFFDHIRPMFGRLTPAQVEGCEAILKAMQGDRVSWCAYSSIQHGRGHGSAIHPSAAHHQWHR